MRTLIKSFSALLLAVIVGVVAAFMYLALAFGVAEAGTKTTTSTTTTTIPVKVRVGGKVVNPTNVCNTWLRLADISSNQPHPIDWTKYVKSGMAGVYVKSTEGVWYTNPFYAGDIAAANAHGLPYGSYDFARPDSSLNAVADATHFFKAGGTKGQLPPALDLETSGSSPSFTVQWAITWLNTVKKLSGKTPILYTGSYYSWAGAISLGSWKLWLAAYPHAYNPTDSACGLTLPYVATPWKSQGWVIWQFTSRGTVSGIGGNVDLDAAIPSWWATVTGATVAPPTKKHPIPTPVYAPGSHGVLVSYVQKILVKEGLLKSREVTGQYDLVTEAAVKRYQRLMGITPDGLWGINTAIANAWYQKYNGPVETLANYPMLKEWTAYHDKVRWIQTKLNEAGWHIPIDGIWGPQTQRCIVAFQKSRHILPVWYGITDLSTWRALWSVR